MFKNWAIPVNEDTLPCKIKSAFSLKTMKLLATTPQNQLNCRSFPPKTNYNLLDPLQIQLMMSDRPLMTNQFALHPPVDSGNCQLFTLKM